MEVLGLTFVGTFSPSRPEMAAFVRDVLGLVPQDARGMDADVFALPDGTTRRGHGFRRRRVRSHDRPPRP